MSYQRLKNLPAANQAGKQPGPGREDSPGQSSDAPPSDKDKAQIRRQQVRRAQIQHRQRKANYTKQLELDVNSHRQMVASVEQDILGFQRQNDAIRRALQAFGISPPPPLTHVDHRPRGGPGPSAQPWPGIQEGASSLEPHPQLRNVRPSTSTSGQQQVPPQQVPFPPPAERYPLSISVPSQSNVMPAWPYDNDLTVTMSMDDLLKTPCLQVSPSSSSSNLSSASHHTEQPPGPPLSPEQEMRAINLVLALEHICWDHFHLQDQPEHGDPSKSPGGHALMASALCMADAPPSVYESKRAFRRIAIAPFAGAKNKPASESPSITWGASSSGAHSGINLQSLLGLASTLNAGDVELTPVQAWFEMAARYGSLALLEGPVVDALKREFSGVVKCLHFGAVIERDAFESVVARVMTQVGVPARGQEQQGGSAAWEAMDTY